MQAHKKSDIEIETTKKNELGREIDPKMFKRNRQN